MTPAAANAGSWIPLAGLVLAFFGFCIQAALFAFFMGKLSARVHNLELRPVDSGSDCKAELAALNATMAGFKEAILTRVSSLEDNMRELFRRNAA